MEHFYSDLLGLPCLRRWPDASGQGERSIWLDLAPGFLALERCDGNVEVRPFRDARAGLHLVALTMDVARREAWRARLAARGVAIVHETEFSLYVHDPEGNRVALSHWPTPRAGHDEPRGSGLAPGGARKDQ